MPSGRKSSSVRELETKQSHVAQAKVRTNTPGVTGNGNRSFLLQLEIFLLYSISFLLRHLCMNLSTLSIGFKKKKEKEKSYP